MNDPSIERRGQWRRTLAAQRRRQAFSGIVDYDFYTSNHPSH
jgi:hypothetical protein